MVSDREMRDDEDRQKYFQDLIDKYYTDDEDIKAKARSFVMMSRLRFVRRFSTKPLVNSQNVMEHCGSVAIFGCLFIVLDAPELLLEEKYNFLVKLILHDIHESVTGDIIWPVKRVDDTAEASYNKAADKGIRKIFDYVNRMGLLSPRMAHNKQTFFTIATGTSSYKGNTIVDQLVEFFDRLDILIYVREEERFSNRHLMKVRWKVMDMLLNGIFDEDSENSDLVFRLRQLAVMIYSVSWQSNALDLNESEGGQ